MNNSLLAAFVALCVLSKVQVKAGAPLKAKEVKALKEQYGLTESPFGNFFNSETYESSATIDLTSGPVPLGASYLILFNGVCKGWIVFPETDRVYTWISGKTMIDLAKPDGQITPVCLGDSLADPNCVYTLVVPAGWKTNFRPTGHLLFTGTTIGGSVANGAPVSFDTMREQYSEYTALINEVEAKCS